MNYKKCNDCLMLAYGFIFGMLAVTIAAAIIKGQSDLLYFTFFLVPPLSLILGFDAGISLINAEPRKFRWKINFGLITAIYMVGVGIFAVIKVGRKLEEAWPGIAAAFIIVTAIFFGGLALPWLIKTLKVIKGKG